MKVSMKKISEITGFSTATVSNALNYKKGVNAETSAKIIRVAQDLGYYGENHIRKVKFVMFKSDGSVVEDSPFFIQLLSGVEEECRANGMEMQVCDLDKRDSGYKDRAKWIMNDKASAVILLGTEMMDSDVELIRGMTCPFVVIDYWKEDMSFDTILINNVDSACMATEYLIANGHRKIGYLQGKNRIKPFRSRSAGYRAALQKCGITLNKEYVFSLSTTIDGAYNDMKRFLAKKEKMPTAFFADNDMIALGAMKAMTEFGIKIPEDVSIVGFDDLAFSAASYPPLTTLRVPKQEMGKVIVRRLRDVIQDKDGVNVKMQVCAQFVERKSVRKI